MLTLTVDFTAFQAIYQSTNGQFLQIIRLFNIEDLKGGGGGEEIETHRKWADTCSTDYSRIGK